MDWTFLLYVLLSVMNVLIATYVYLRDPPRLTNKVFGFFGGTIALWTMAISLAYNPATESLLFVRSTFAAASLMLLGLLTLFLVFPASPFPRDPLYLLFACISLGFSILAFSSLLVRGVSREPSGLVLSYGDLYSLFGFYVYASLGSCLWVIRKKLRTATGLVRQQLRYLLLGLLLPGIAVTITNLFIPLVFTTSRFGRYGPAFSLVFVGLTAHAIIRHRLMNIRLVIRRGVVYLLAVATAGGVFISLLGLMTTFVFMRPRDLPLWVEVGLVLLVALLFQPFRRWIQISMDRYLYRESYDYQRTIREASKTIGSMLDLKSLLRYVCEVIGRTVRPEFVSIYIKTLETPTYTQMAMRRFIEDSSDPNLQTTLSNSSPLINLLSTTRASLIRDDLRQGRGNGSASEALWQLAEMGGEVVLPILHEEQLSGFVIIAPKLSGDPYFSEDIDLLSTLVSQSAIAIQNAQLYREVALVNEYVTNIVATMESGVIAVDTNEKVTLFNPAAERITAIPVRSIRSSSINLLPTAVTHPLQATLADGQPRVQAETTIPDATGHYTLVSYSTHPLRDSMGQILGAVGVFSDLTRLKELEVEKRRAERLASIGALASGIAHEIKNPLVAIKTFAELLPERFTEQDFREDFSQVVIREISRIDDLVARLRGLAAPSTSPLSPLDLRDPIEETLVLLRGQLEQKRTRVRRQYERVVPLVAGDPAQLKQLFLNLFMNALEAMDPGGELTIRLARREGFGAPSLLVEVGDTGHGIPGEMLGRIFDPFVTTKPRGSGLGLAICRGIADTHRATIRAENRTNGRGAIITIDFLVIEDIPAALRT